MKPDSNETMMQQRPDPDADQRRIADLEEQLAEARQEKDRLLGLLDKALTTISSQHQRAGHVKPPEPMPAAPGDAQGGASDDWAWTGLRRPKAGDETRSGWEKLKDWFFNA